MRNKLPPGTLHLDGAWVSLDGSTETDVAQFRAHLAAERWAQTAELASADVLPGLSPPDAEGFSDWRSAQTEQFRDESLRALGEWGRRLEVSGQYREALAAQQPTTTTAAGHLLPLTGREDALYALSRARVSLELGEAGVGKSRLCAAAFLPEPGLRLRASADLSRVPYAALAEALARQQRRWSPAGSPELAALARLLPGLGVPGEPLPDERALFIQHLGGALKAVLGGEALLIKDVHWLDTGSLEVVAHLIRYGSERLVLICAASRNSVTCWTHWSVTTCCNASSSATSARRSFAA